MSTYVIIVTRTAKKTVKHYENGPKQSIFRPPLGTNRFEKYLDCIINSYVIIQEIFSAKGSLLNVTQVTIATKTTKK